MDRSQRFGFEIVVMRVDIADDEHRCEFITIYDPEFPDDCFRIKYLERVEWDSSC